MSRRLAAGVADACQVKKALPLLALLAGCATTPTGPHVLVLPGTGEEGAKTLAERLRHRVEDLRIPHAHSKLGPHLTISVGVASAVPKPGSDPAELLDAADRAVYAAKEEGRNRVKVGRLGT